MADAVRGSSGRSTLVAVILSGLGPGAGHAYVGRPLRGLILTLLWGASNFAWTRHVAESWTAARLWALPPLLILLALVIDSGRLARLAPAPVARNASQRWWWYALIIVLTGILAPAALTGALKRQVSLVTVADSGLEPHVQALDRVVLRRDIAGIVRGTVVAVRRGDHVLLRRIVGLPGELVELRGGAVQIDGQLWLQDPSRLLGSGRQTTGPLRIAPSQVMVLPDQRPPGVEVDAVVPRGEILGIARWILVPADLDALRVGQAIP